MVVINNKKLMKLGNAYAFLVPKALIDCEVLSLNKEYIIKVSQKVNKEDTNNANEMHRLYNRLISSTSNVALIV